MDNMIEDETESSYQTTSSSAGMVIDTMSTPASDTSSGTGRALGILGIRGAIIDPKGYLLRNRPPQRWIDWTKVPVGRAASLQLSHGLSSRDLEIMRFAERFGMVTLEQITRVFFNSEDPASSAVMKLRKRRYLAKIEVHPPFLADAVGRRPGVTNSVYILDWNGFYYLRYHANGTRASVASGTNADTADSESNGPGGQNGIGRASREGGGDHEAGDQAISRWNPATVAQVNSRLGHTLGVSEVWSYIMTAARATYERPTPQHPEDPIKYRLKAYLLNERESCIPSNLAMLSRGATPNAGKFLAIPDATIALSFQVSLPHSPSFPSGSSGSSVTHWRSHQPSLWVLPDEKDDRTGAAHVRRGANQYDLSLRSWQHVFLPVLPFPARGQIVEPSSPFAPRYRFLFVEMETGTNNHKDLLAKIAGYNRVYGRQEIWHYLYGERFPRVLVVVRAKEQIERTATIWRSEFAHRAQTAVLVTSLHHLAEVYALSRRGLIELPCWLDVLNEQRPTWRTLDDALAIDLVVSQAVAAVAAGA